ncbi:hypothetical protein [uncultured Thiodictyon sp.]|jgi:hypothetical protein|uniref:sacsin N-terminal ATP-binding-like domain-containing protein n=1 Tax=uncultured Thiodictyon sp. TaxID=1846217 RepID=UPI0025F9AC67|nr:hypothetical protein [uncultured Thiodictyon sp.]
MSFIEVLREKRQKFLDGLDANEGDINLDIFEDFYPDKAHFVFELLQNAEDALATACEFTLRNDICLFEHDGKREFEEPDVRAITGIHNSTKKKAPDQIGKFGVGFKSVFIYTLNPSIYSRRFCFSIRRLVMPESILEPAGIGSGTTFAFPFDNPQKPPKQAYQEIHDGLMGLSDATLLFLTHIESIRWRIDDENSGAVQRVQHSEHHIEVLKQIGGAASGSSHYLRFTQAVEGLEKQRIAVAFALELLPNAGGFNSMQPLADQFRIVPAVPAHVAVFFPAEKETSGLRFHLHAPFVPELSRASIKETPANAPLYRQLASLTASSLYAIRDLKLLTADFLGVLPNPQDVIPDRYDCIRQAIVTEMVEKPLTPTNSKGHAPAKHLLQAKASLKSLLSLDDIKVLVDGMERAPRWAIAGSIKHSVVDRFLSGLNIREWDIEQLVKLLENAASDQYRFDSSDAKGYRGPDRSFIAWLAAKPEEWHQKFYALLAAEYFLDPEYSKRQLLEKLRPLHIVRLNSGEYSEGSKCFFPMAEMEQNERFPQVAKGVFTSGKHKIEKERARKLLEALGVRYVGEFEQVEAILNQRYDTDIRPSKGDLNRFIALVEKDADRAVIFRDYWIFQREDDKWGQPGQVYLDAPYLDTGLTAYFGALGEDADQVALSKDYQEAEISTKRLVDFARRVGVITELSIEETTCQNNPDAANLVHRAQGGKSPYKIDKDYRVRGLDQVLERADEVLSRLVWRTCANVMSPDWTKAQYRNNNSYPCNEAPSQLAVLLRSKKWIPQRGGAFVCPADAARELLPDGFAFDPGWSWLNAIQFGQSIAKQSAESRRKREVAIELGFSDDDSLNDAKWFAELDPDERQRFKSQYESKHRTDLPEHEPTNPGRRANRVQDEAAEAPERITEKRTRSVSVGRESVKKDTDPYLRQQYTNSDGETICQVCKATLPFRLSDGTYYLEAVEFLPELKRRHYQNYLALCPNHAAMFQHANGSREMMMDDFLRMKGNELALILADANSSVYFTKTHAMDIRAVIWADESGIEEDEE